MGLPLFLGFLFCSALSFASDLHYYSANYDLARGRFLDEARATQQQISRSQIITFPVPSAVDRSLSVDYFYIPAASSQETLVVVVSGVHGIEGFAGSAIQVMLLKEFRQYLDSEKNGFFFVHSMNPYGFKYHRRATENNVNLNRNFSTAESLFRTPNIDYRQLAAVLEPRGPVKSVTCSNISTLWSIGADLVFGRFTLDGLNRAIGQGQFEFPSGLEFGGSYFEPQTEDLVRMLKGVTRNYKNVVLIDLHTGLGEKYELHLMPADGPASVDEMLFAKFFHVTQDRPIYKYTPTDAEGFYHTHGDLTNILPEILHPGQKALGVTMEFDTIGNSTLSKLQTLNRLVLENMAFHFGYTDLQIEQEVKTDFDNLFFPADLKWRTNVITRSREVFRRVFQRLDSKRQP